MKSTHQAIAGRLRLLFIRHGETQDNIDRVLQGLRDTSLTPKGHKEAQILALKLRDEHIDAIYHSPLTRIRQTIQPIIANQPVISVYVDADLVGQALGEFEGSSYDTIDMSNPRSADGGPGVEDFDDFVRRLKRVFARIIGKEAPLVRKEDRTVVIATHGVGITSVFKMLEASPSCDGFGPKVARRKPQAFEVRWTDSDDVARLVVGEAALPVKGGVLDWDEIQGEVFVIERWGRRRRR